METHIDQLTPIALVTTAALFGGLLFFRLRQPVIVGYIIAGAILGPSGFALISETETVKVLAELGIIMLLFLIGMEMSLRGFKSVYKIAMMTAGLQIAVFTGFFYALGSFLDWPIGRILIFGFSVALSSTAVAIKILEETGDLRTMVGRVAVAVLIAQDLAIIPMILIVKAVAGHGADGGEEAWLMVVRLAAAVGFLTLLIWFLTRRERLRFPLIDTIEDRADIMTIAALAICFTLATASGALGLSTAYGAFIAGLIIGNSNARTAMHNVTQPIQAVLLMIFFLSIGLLIDFAFIREHFAMVAFVLVMVTFFKTLFNIIILHYLGEPWERAFESGVVLGQVGEFSFILVGIGLASGAITEYGYRFVVAIIALSLMFSPMWQMLAQRIHDLTAAGKTDFRTLLDAVLLKTRRKSTGELVTPEGEVLATPEMQPAPFDTVEKEPVPEPEKKAEKPAAKKKPAKKKAAKKKSASKKSEKKKD